MPFYDNIQSLTGDFGDIVHETEVDTDSNHEEVKHIVKVLGWLSCRKRKKMNNSGFWPFQVGHLGIASGHSYSDTVDWGSIKAALSAFRH